LIAQHGSEIGGDHRLGFSADFTIGIFEAGADEHVTGVGFGGAQRQIDGKTGMHAHALKRDLLAECRLFAELHSIDPSFSSALRLSHGVPDAPVMRPSKLLNDKELWNSTTYASRNGDELAEC
jgi:hypothetical protein